MNRAEIESILQKWLDFINSPKKNPKNLDDLLHQDFKINLDFHGLNVDLSADDLDRGSFIDLTSNYGVPKTVVQNNLIDEIKSEACVMWNGYFEQEGAEAWRLMYYLKFKDNKIIEFSRIGDGSWVFQNEFALSILKQVVDKSVETGKMQKIEEYIKSLRDEGLINIDS